MNKKRYAVRKHKKIKRMAHFHWGFPPIIGGVETHLATILPSFVQSGYEVHLLTGAAEKSKTRENYEGVHVLRTPLMDLNWLYKRGLNGLEDELEDLLKKFLEHARPDLMHAHNMSYFSKTHATCLADAAKRHGVPLILTTHNSWDDNLFLDLIRNISWDHIIAVSHFIKRELIGCGVDDAKIRVVHHGVDHRLYNPEGPTREALKKYPHLKNRPVIFHPARMGLAKGCDVSIKALNLIREHVPNIMMVLAGTTNIIDWGSTQPKEIAYMVNLVDFFKLRDNILIDSYPLAMMPQLYRLSDVCIYPSSVCEPFGLTMLEALSSCRPMIVTDMGGMPEIIKDGINGFVVPVRDFETLASKCIHLLQNAKKRNRLGYTGQQMVHQQFTIDDVAQNTLDVYNEVFR